MATVATRAAAETSIGAAGEEVQQPRFVGSGVDVPRLDVACAGHFDKRDQVHVRGRELLAGGEGHIVVGVAVGLLAGYAGGLIDSVLMRVADVQLTFPSILTALLVDGVITAALPRTMREALQIDVIIFAIGVSLWPNFARTVRGSTLVERNKDYVMAARVIGVPSWRIMFSHVLPNVTGPVMVIGTLNLGLAIIAEATLSFLGVGLPPTQPSLGTLIRFGDDFLFSGQWWVSVFPGVTLVLMVLAINLLGDWLRDALNPRLR